MLAYCSSVISTLREHTKVRSLPVSHLGVHAKTARFYAGLCSYPRTAASSARSRSFSRFSSCI